MMDIIHLLYGKWSRRVLVAGCLAALMLFTLSCDLGRDRPVAKKPFSEGLFKGEMEIEINPTVPVHGKSKEFVEGLRTELISKYPDLGIFPKDYSLSSVVFGQVTWGDDWLDDVQIYVNNPYLLVMTGAAGKVNPFLTFCGVESVTYKTGRIEVLYRGQQTSRWFRYVYDFYNDNDDMVRLNFVNAFDAGFKFAHIDGSKSANLDTALPTETLAAIDSVYRISEFYHVGRYKKNNKSPLDRKAWIRFIKRDAPTRIFIKLWRERPSGPEAKEDLAYVISLEP